MLISRMVYPANLPKSVRCKNSKKKKKKYQSNLEISQIFQSIINQSSLEMRAKKKNFLAKEKNNRQKALYSLMDKKKRKEKKKSKGITGAKGEEGMKTR